MAENPIKWRKEDEARLKKAVSDFNNKIKRLEKEENLLYLPDTIKYTDTRQDIKTRAEYNRRINALESFMKKGAEDLTITKGGEGLSKWEWQQILNKKRILENRLNKGISKFESNVPGVKSLMGSPEKAQAEATLESLQKINKTKGASFNRIKSRIQTLGVKDYEMKQAIKYRHNLLNELEKIKDNSIATAKLYEHFKNIKNPIEFYDEIKKSDVLYDFFKWYKNPKDYGDFKGYGTISRYIINEIEEFDAFDDYILNLLEED